MGREANRRVAIGVRLAVAGVAIATVAVAAAAPAASAPPASADAGAPEVAEAAGPPVQLPGPAAVGQQADVVARISQNVPAGAFELAISTSTAVTAVSAEGYTTRSTISALDVTEGAEIAGEGVNNLTSQSFEQSFTTTGAAIPQASTLINAAALPPAQQQSGRALIDAISMVHVGFPAGPVAAGSAWTSDGSIGSLGTVIAVKYQCRLTAVDATNYTMEVSYTQTFSHAEAPGAIEATVAGSGTITGSVSNPMILSATMYQTVDGIDGSMPLHTDTSVALTSTAR